MTWVTFISTATHFTRNNLTWTAVELSAGNIKRVSANPTNNWNEWSTQRGGHWLLVWIAPTKFKVVITSGRLFQSVTVICQILYLYVSNFRRNELLCKFSDGLSSWMKTIRKLGSQNCFYTCGVHNSDLADFACALQLKIVWLIVCSTMRW